MNKFAEIPSSPVFADMNTQISHELYNSNVYYAAGIYFGNLALEGFEKWCYASMDDERVHAKKFSDYLLDREYNPTINSLPAPPSFKGKSTQEVIEMILSIEQVTTKQIKAMYTTATAADDFLSAVFLHDLLIEQVEEERKVFLLIDQMKLFGASGVALQNLDNKIAG